MHGRAQRWAAVTALLVGIGLATAPLAFGMFSRAPLGGTMIDEFRPYMVEAKIAAFRDSMDTIDAAVVGIGEVRAGLIESGTVTSDEFDVQYSGVTQLVDEWATIEADMSDLLDRMDANMGNYRAVAALPPFPLFPWFFVLPGVMVAALAGSILWSLRDPTRRDGSSPRRRLWALAALGVAIIAAPIAFQMFTRAPQGGDMIDSFRPMMTRERVQSVQRSFVILGGAEGQMRVGLVPAYLAAGGDEVATVAIDEFSTQWPTIVSDFNPMIATMSDNIDNFQAVDALPPFALFPWFFAIPGAIVASCAAIGLRGSASPTQSSEKEPS
ncbi:MAG: hypothetical protein Q8M22_20995 [Actinomycetota bacterium]|nr:hypothetical protein [Actinomycetota bacterium]